MKVIISGPRRLPSRTNPADPWPHMHVELDLPEIPAVGEHITLNGGGSFTVKRRFWYVESPENEAYYSWNANYDTDQGRYDVVYLDVLPSGYDEPFTYDKAVAEGTERGRGQVAAEVEKLLALTGRPGVDPASVLIIVREMVRQEAAQAHARAELAEQHRAFAEKILDALLAGHTEAPAETPPTG